MNTVEVSYAVEPSYNEVIEFLSPRNIIRFANIYCLESQEEIIDGTEITVSFEGEILIFKFSKIDDGYSYELVESTGLFSERYSTIVVNDEGEFTKIEAETKYTLNTRLSFIVDRLAVGTIQQELEMTIENLVAEAIEKSNEK